MRVRPGTDVTAMLKGIVARDVRKVMMPPDDVTKVTKVTVASREERLDKEKMFQLGQVMVALDGMRETTDRKTLPEIQDNSQEALIAWGPTMSMVPGEEREAKVEALQRKGS